MSDLARVRLLIDDDHAIWRSGLKSELGENFHVVGEAADADEAIAAIATHEPDLVVCDLNMPGGGIKVVRACSETTRIVMLTVSEAERDLLDAVSAGAAGYLLKTTPPNELRNELFIAAKTVENHVRNILKKLHLNRKQELIRYALDHGID